MKNWASSVAVSRQWQVCPEVLLYASLESFLDPPPVGKNLLLMLMACDYCWWWRLAWLAGIDWKFGMLKKGAAKFGGT